MPHPCALEHQSLHEQSSSKVPLELVPVLVLALVLSVLLLVLVVVGVLLLAALLPVMLRVTVLLLLLLLVVPQSTVQALQRSLLGPGFWLLSLRLMGVHSPLFPQELTPALTPELTPASVPHASP